MTGEHHILTLSCTDRPGIVGAVGTCLAAHDCNIVESAQFGDLDTGRFMMRVCFERLEGAPAIDRFKAAYQAIATRFEMEWTLHDRHARPRVLVLVSRLDHCLNDILYRRRTGTLPIDVVAVASNHRDCEALATSHGVAFRYLPIAPGARDAQEAQLAALIDDTRPDLVVLARYMQILSDAMCRRLVGRAINIHHSFLPSFVGAKPYHQAHARGVKLIGATAHYVTSNLDEGPIIEQEVARVTHGMTVEELATVGRDIESQVLARAVRYHIEHRVFLNGQRTVVFR